MILLQIFVYFIGYFGLYMLFGWITRNKLNYSISDYMYCVTISVMLHLAADVIYLPLFNKFIVIAFLPVLSCSFIFVPFTRVHVKA